MLVGAGFLQGAAAAVMMPSSMALIREAYPSGGQQARALAGWAMGGAVASSSAPVLGGLLNRPAPRAACSTQSPGRWCLAVAVFGALLAHRATFLHGERVALFIATAVFMSAAVISMSLKKRGNPAPSHP